MTNFTLNKKEINWEFNGLKIISTNEPEKIERFLRQILEFEKEKIFLYENKSFSEKDVFFLKETTNLSNIFSLTKNSILYKELFSLFINEDIVSSKQTERLETFIFSCNFTNEIDINFDINKMFSLFFHLKNRFIETKDVKNFLKICKNQSFKPLVILTDCSFIDRKTFTEIIDQCETIVLTRDPKKYLLNDSFLETLVVEMLNGQEVEVLDKSSFQNFLENKLGEMLSISDWNDYFSEKNTEKTRKIDFLLKNLY